MDFATAENWRLEIKIMVSSATSRFRIDFWPYFCVRTVQTGNSLESDLAGFGVLNFRSEMTEFKFDPICQFPIYWRGKMHARRSLGMSLMLQFAWLQMRNS